MIFDHARSIFAYGRSKPTHICSGIAHIVSLCRLRFLGSLSHEEDVRYWERRVEVARKRVEFLKFTFFIEKQLNHSKDVVKYHLRHRANFTIGSVGITLRIGTSKDTPPQEYEAYKVDCDAHLSSDKYGGVLEYEREANDVVSMFNAEAEELEREIISSLRDKLPPEWDGSTPEPSSYTTGYDQNITYMLAYMFNNGQIAIVHSDRPSGKSLLNLQTTFVVCNVRERSKLETLIQEALDRMEVWDKLNLLRALYDYAVEQIQKFDQQASIIVRQVDSGEIPLDGECDTYRIIKEKLTSLGV